MSPVETLLAEVLCPERLHGPRTPCHTCTVMAAEQAKALREWVLSDETVGVAARVIGLLEPDDDWPSNEYLGGGPTGTRDDEYRDAAYDDARRVCAALADLIGGAQ